MRRNEERRSRPPPLRSKRNDSECGRNVVETMQNDVRKTRRKKRCYELDWRCWKRTIGEKIG